METGNLLSDAALAQVQDVIRLVLKKERRSTEHQETQRGRISSRFPIHAVILDDALNAALDPVLSGFLDGALGTNSFGVLASGLAMDRCGDLGVQRLLARLDSLSI